jgi:guanine deaminase
MRDAGVTVVHCANSNNSICSGLAPIRVMLDEGLKVALGSDVAGGDTISMFNAVADAIRASKNRRILDNWQTDFLTVPEGWYLGTSAGAAFFGDRPGLAAGNPLHAIVLDDSQLLQPRPLSVRERFERCVYYRQPNAIRQVWSQGRIIYG